MNALSPDIERLFDLYVEKKNVHQQVQTLFADAEKGALPFPRTHFQKLNDKLRFCEAEIFVLRKRIKLEMNEETCKKVQELIRFTQYKMSVISSQETEPEIRARKLRGTTQVLTFLEGLLL